MKYVNDKTDCVFSDVLILRFYLNLKCKIGAVEFKFPVSHMCRGKDGV